MKTWRNALIDGALSGSIASVASTAVLALRGKQEAGSAYAPINAISHWYWGDRAARRDDPSLAHTAPGYMTHHMSSVFWATFYEKWFGDRAQRGDTVAAVAGGLAVAGLACFVDYKLTPHRLQPGYEQRLSSASLAGVYGVFGLALAARSLLGLSAGDLWNKIRGGGSREPLLLPYQPAPQAAHG